MRLSFKRQFIIFLILFIACLFLGLVADCAHAQNGNSGPATVFHNTTIEEARSNNANNVYYSQTFWQLPLWIQLLYASFAIMAILGLIKALPIISGRLKHVFENPKTKEVFDFILGNPGVTIAELSKEQDINRGTLKYHLGQLFANNKIMLIRKGRFSRLLYNNPRANDKESQISRLLKNDKNKELLFMIMDNPGITNQDLSSKFKLDKSTITDYLKKYSDDDIVEFRHDGKFKRCYLRQDARLILLRYKP